MSEHEAEVERIRAVYDKRAATAPPRSGGPDLRWLCSEAEGDTLEIGIGRGRTLPFYPNGIRLFAIDVSPVSLGIARRRAHEIGVHATMVEGDAARLPYPSEHFDVVLFAFSLCTIPDDREAISEAVRVLRPGGRLALVEHVRSPVRLVRGFERLIEPITIRKDGDHLTRDPLDHILAEDLEVEYLERRMLGLVERLAARKPECNDLAEAV